MPTASDAQLIQRVGVVVGKEDLQTRYGLEATPIGLPRPSMMNDVFPTTAILDNPLIVLITRLPAFAA